MVFGIGTRVNEYWCGNGTITEVDSEYFKVDWDSGLTNEAITGYHKSILSRIDN